MKGKKMPKDKWLYAVITIDSSHGLDLILETREDAVKHAAELSDLGCTTMIVPVLDQDTLCDAN